MAGASGFMAEVSQEEYSDHSHAWDHSPRAGGARSQVSMAVSAALSSQAFGESALSAAEQQQDTEGAGEHSSQPSLPGLEEGQGQHHIVAEHVEQPANSLLSTAMQPSSPPIHRANSVVSHTAVHGAVPRTLTGLRASTPASVYTQARAVARPRPQSPQGSTAGQQHSSAGDEVRTSSQRHSRRPSQSSARALGERERQRLAGDADEEAQAQGSLWQQAASQHLAGAVSLQQVGSVPGNVNGNMGYQGPFQGGLSTHARSLSIDAMQQGGADSQRPASAVHAGEGDEQQAISQPILVAAYGGLANGFHKAAASFGGSGPHGSHIIGQHVHAVPQASSFIAGPALPPPAQGLTHPFAALSAALAPPHFMAHLQQAMSQNGHVYGVHPAGPYPGHMRGFYWAGHPAHQLRFGGLYGGAEVPQAASANTHPLGMGLRFPHPPQRPAGRSEDGSHVVPPIPAPRIASTHCQSSCHQECPPANGPAQSGTLCPGETSAAMTAAAHSGGAGGPASGHPFHGAPSGETAPPPGHSHHGAPPQGGGGYGFRPPVWPEAAQVTLPASADGDGSRGASPAVDQAPPHDVQQGSLEPAHAAASVHATVLSEEDVLSEVETDLSSMHGREGPSHVATSLVPSNRPARSPGSSISRDAGGSALAAATGEDTLGAPHRCRSGSKEAMPYRVNSTDGMAGAPAHRSAWTRSGTVEMMQGGSPGRPAHQASTSEGGQSIGEAVRSGAGDRPATHQGATSVPGAMPAVTSPMQLQRVGLRAARSPPPSASPALAVDIVPHTSARNGNGRANGEDGTPSDSRMGVQGDHDPPPPACETTLGMLQAAQPLSAITTAADQLPAGSRGSNGEDMEVDGNLPILAAPGHHAGPTRPSASHGLPPLPSHNRRRSADASVAMGPPARSRPVRNGVDNVATSQPRPAPATHRGGSPSPSNTSCRLQQPAPAQAVGPMHGPYPEDGDDGPQAAAAVSLSGAMPALTVLTNGAEAPTAPTYELESVPAPGALIPHPGPQPALTIVSGMVDSWQPKASHAPNSRRSSSRAAVSRSCDSATGHTNGQHTQNGLSTSNGHLSNGRISNGSSAPVTSPSVAAGRGRRESSKRKRCGATSHTTSSKRATVNGQH